MSTRGEVLSRLGEIILQGKVTNKLDFLGTIEIQGCHYFNVFRRYNNVYEIVIEDAWCDYHYHRNYTVRESMARILCMNDTSHMTVQDAISYKNQSPIYDDVLDMRWSEIQGRYAGLSLSLGGIHDMIRIPSWSEQSTDSDSELTATPAPKAASLPAAPRKEVRVTGAAPSAAVRRLSDRFAAVEKAATMEHFPENLEYTLLRNGTKVMKRTS